MFRREVGIDGEVGFKLYGSTSTLKNLVIVVEIYMAVSKNRGCLPPKSSHLFIGFSIIFTIHFGGKPPISPFLRKISSGSKKSHVSLQGCLFPIRGRNTTTFETYLNMIPVKSLVGAKEAFQELMIIIPLKEGIK